MLRTLHSPCRQLSARAIFGRSYSDVALHIGVTETNSGVNALVFIPEIILNIIADSRDRSLRHMPIAVKDNICTKDMPTTCSSKMLRDFTSPFDATVVELIRKAGASIIGKTNCDEFGMGSLNVYSDHGPVVNPYRAPSATQPWAQRERRSAGGSSGGSAAAVASGMCLAALGTDTGGSVRLPASYCGVVGLKPSYGIISRWGVISYADSLDCVGVLGANVGCVEQVFHTVAQYDLRDPSAAIPETREKAVAECERLVSRWVGSSDLSGLRIGIPQEYFPTEISPAIIAPFRNLIDDLKKRRASIVSVSLPSTPYALSAYYVIASAEASSNLARYDGVEYGLRVDPPKTASTKKTANVYAHSRSQGFGPEVQKRILLGTYALTADAFDNYFLQAQRVRSLVRADFDKVFRARNVLLTDSQANDGDSSVDVLLHPSAIQTAPLLDVKNPLGDLGAYVQDVLAVPASLAGLPALSVPAGLGEDGWPVGVSVVGQWGCDEVVLKVGKIIEEIVRERNDPC